MKDLLNRTLMAAAGVMLAVTFAAVALVAGGGAFSAGGGSVDAPLLALVAGVLAAGVARGIRSARAAAGGASHRRGIITRGRRFGSLVSRHSL